MQTGFEGSFSAGGALRGGPGTQKGCCYHHSGPWFVFPHPGLYVYLHTRANNGPEVQKMTSWTKMKKPCNPKAFMELRQRREVTYSPVWSSSLAEEAQSADRASWVTSVGTHRPRRRHRGSVLLGKGSPSEAELCSFISRAHKLGLQSGLSLAPHSCGHRWSQAGTSMLHASQHTSFAKLQASLE